MFHNMDRTEPNFHTTDHKKQRSFVLKTNAIHAILMLRLMSKTWLGLVLGTLLGLKTWLGPVLVSSYGPAALN